MLICQIFTLEDTDVSSSVKFIIDSDYGSRVDFLGESRLPNTNNKTQISFLVDMLDKYLDYRKFVKHRAVFKCIL